MEAGKDIPGVFLTGQNSGMDPINGWIPGGFDRNTIPERWMGQGKKSNPGIGKREKQQLGKAGWGWTPGLGGILGKEGQWE